MLKLQNGDYDGLQVCQLFISIFINQTTSWLVHSSNIFGAQMNHGHKQIHHDPALGEAITFPFIVDALPSHGVKPT